MSPFFKPVGTGLAALALFLGIWSLASLWVPAYILPLPWEIPARFPVLLTPVLLWDLQATLIRVTVGFSAALILGTLVGMVSVALRLAMFMETLMVMVQIMPGLILGIIFLAFFGTGSMVPVCLAVTLITPLIAIHTANGLARPNPLLQEVILSFNGGRLQVLYYLFLPALVPALKSNITIGMIMAVKLTLIGEFLASGNGLGYRLNLYCIHFDMVGVFFCLVIVFLGLGLFQAGVNLVFGLFLAPCFNAE